jgi:hypothetical protein
MTQHEPTESDLWADEVIDLVGAMTASAPDRGAAATVMVNVLAMFVMRVIRESHQVLGDIATGVRAAIKQNLHLCAPSGEVH